MPKSNRVDFDDNRKKFFNENRTVNAEPHQSAASIVPLPFAVISKSFWIRKTGTGPGSQKSSKYKILPETEPDGVTALAAIEACLNYAAKACPQRFHHEGMDDGKVQICWPERADFRPIDEAQSWVEGSGCTDRPGWWENNISLLSKKLLEELQDRAFEIKFSPWAIERNHEQSRFDGRRVRILIRFEMSREILSITINLAERNSPDFEPLEAFWNLHTAIRDNYGFTGDHDYSELAEVLEGDREADREKRMRLIAPLRRMQRDVQETGLTRVWEEIFKKKFEASFTHFRGLIINPRMFMLDPHWKEFFESSSRYTNRLNYYLTDPLNILPPTKSRRIINPSQHEVSDPSKASRGSFRRWLRDEKPPEISDREAIERLVQSYEGAIPGDVLPDWEKENSEGMLVEGVRLFLEAITGFAFSRSVYGKDGETAENTELQFHVPESLINKASRDPLASMLGSNQAILLTTAGGNSATTEETGEDHTPIVYFHIYYLREQRVPISRLVKRQMEGGTMRYASLRCLHKLREAGEKLGEAERLYDRQTGDSVDGFLDVIGRGALAKTVRQARRLQPQWSGVRESLTYRVNRSRYYRTTLEETMKLQRGGRIATWQSYEDFLNKRIFQTLDYISRFSERLAAIESKRFERRVRYATIAATVLAAFALIRGIPGSIMNNLGPAFSTVSTAAQELLGRI